MDQVSRASDAYFQYGVLGATTVLFLLFILLIASELRKEQKARIEDAKATQAFLLDVIRQCTASLASVAESQKGTKDALIELKDAFKEFGEELRRTRR